MTCTEDTLVVNDVSNNQSSSSVNEDSVNPFFLSSSDNNIVQLVSQKLVEGRNYFPWARLMNHLTHC